MDTSFESNDYYQDVFSKTDVILYAKRLENELKGVQSENARLHHQLNQMETENRSKDQLLNEASEENSIFKQEIEQLRRQFQQRVPRNNINKPTHKGVSMENKVNKPRAYSMGAMNARSVSTPSMSVHSHNTINTIHEDKGPKIISGYMFKKGKFNTEFHTRFFVLHANNTLSYYQDASDEDEASLGEISLHSVYDIKEEPTNHIVHLITTTTIHTLRCDDDEDYDRWIHIIKPIVYPKILYKGWLYKRGHRGNTQLTQWNLEFFVLCQLMDYAQHYEVRYYQDEKCKTYKGSINCGEITDIKLLPNGSVSLQKYGKDKILELTTDQRVYLLTANDTQLRNSWYKSFKNVLSNDKQSDHEFQSQSMLLKRSGSKPKERPSFINILQPISEHIPFHPKTPDQKSKVRTRSDTDYMGLVLNSDNNQNIDTNEWRHCFASISPAITPCISPAISPSVSPSGSPRHRLRHDINIDTSRYQIMLSPSDTEDATPLVRNLSISKDAEAMLAQTMMPLGTAKRTFSNESETVTSPFARGRGSSQSSPWSYMSNNSVLLMDINTEYTRLGQLINEFDTKSAEIKYDQMSYNQAGGCELIINSPFDFKM
eukprot:120028_1